MIENERTRAEARTDAALADSGFEDPRPALRARLRYFREEQPAAFSAAVDYYEKTLIPAVLSADADPLSAWVEFGRRLGELAAPGKTVAIDAGGRSRPYHGLIADQLVLHLPDDTAVEALPLALPRVLSNAQRATYTLLINRARSL